MVSGKDTYVRFRVLVLYGLALVVKIGTVAYAAVKLPERIASHFGASGAADGWSSRSSYLTFTILIAAFMMLGLPALGRLLTLGSGTGMNIPNKEYWLRPENRPELRRRITEDMVFLGAVTGLLLSWIDVLVVQANQSATPSLGASSWVAMGAYLSIITGWSIWMMTKRYAVPR